LLKTDVDLLGHSAGLIRKRQAVKSNNVGMVLLLTLQSFASECTSARANS